ncbi:MAG: hypothetical protein C4529_07075 [Deltaproteobacteria bacterium]|nr:MAG: hypothetical protein C4529_07075 [Deltaproteobacteria bacterium]
MIRLPPNPPPWVAAYVGIPFREKGRSTGGVDCWGLVRLVYAERFGVLLPDLSDRYGASEDPRSTSPALESEAAPGGSWRLRGGSPTEVGSVAVFRVRGLPSHVGLAVAEGRFLHSIRGVDSVVEAWDSPLWRDRLVGWYDFVGPVEVRTRRSIFESVPGRIELPEGGTIEEMIRAGGIDPETPGVRVFLGDRVVPRGTWRHVRPKAGRRVTVGIVPEGGQDGGKTIARIVLTIAVIVAAIYLGPQIALGLGYTATGSAAAISTAVVGLAGTLAVNALIPPPRPELSGAGDGSSRISPTITGARNDVRRYAPIPVVLGTHRIVPPFGALPFTEIVGDDQYLRLLFVLGYGPLAIEDLRIGETAIDEFEGVEYEIRNGFPGEGPTSIYPGTVREENLAAALTAASGWALRTSEEADEVSIDFLFPNGLAEIESDGSRANRTVTLEIQYAPAGSGAWVTINLDSPADRRALDYFFRTPESVRLSNGTRTGTRIDWSQNAVFSDSPPVEISTKVDDYPRLSWEASGYIRVPTTGDYVFGIDGSDAADFEIDGNPVASYYGSHVATAAANYAAHPSPVLALTAGDHPFRFRVESRNTANIAAALGWKKPGDASFSTIPAANFFFRSSPYSWIHDLTQGYRFRVFDTIAFGGSLVVSDNRVDLIRRSVSFPVSRGQYDVRVRRVTPDSTSDRIVDSVVWSAIRAILNEEPILVANLARVALRIKATDQLNGVVDNFNALATSILPDYDSFTGEWVSRATQNPASLFRAILQGPANRKPVDTSRVAVSTLEEWHSANNVSGFRGNVVFDYEGTLFERLQIVSSLGRATFGMEDGKFSIVRDRVQTTPVQHFTPRNSSGFKGRRTFPDVPHALRVRFLNSEQGYQDDEVIVYDDGYTSANATRFESMELFGVTDPSLAWRHGRYHIAAGRLRPETFDLTVDFEHLVCRRGDLVLVTHDVPILGTAAGRIRQVVNDADGRPAVVEIDAAVTMESGHTYAMRVRKKDGTFVLVNIATNAGDQTILYLDSPIPVGQPAPEAGDLFGFGDRGYDSREMIVKSIQMGGDLSATLTLIDHAPAVHSADTGTIPPFDSGIVNPPVWDDGPEAPVIASIRSDDFVMVRGADGTLVPRIVVYLRRPSASNRPVPVTIQGRYREAGTGVPYRSVPSVPADGLSISFLPVEQGVEYELAVRYVAANGRVSRWVSDSEEVVGHDLPPPDVVSFSVDQLSDGTRRYVWDLGNEPPDVVGVRIRYATGGSGASWESMTNLLDGDGVLEGASPTDLAVPGSGSWRFAIKMVDRGGLESVNAVFYEKTLGPPPSNNVAWIEDAKSQRWPGTKTHCFVDSPGGGLVAGSQRTWATVRTPWSLWRSWNDEPWPEIEYEHPTVDVGFVFDFEPSVVVEADGDQVSTILFDYSIDGVVWNGYANIRSFEGRTVRARYFRSKVTVSNAAMYPIPALNEYAIILHAPTIVEVLDDLVTVALDSTYRIGPGHFYAPISSAAFAWIRTVSVSFNGTGAGWTWEIVNKNLSPGPEIRVYDSDGNPTDATVDVSVRGIRSSDGSTTSPLPGELRFNVARNAVFVSVL